MKKNKSSRNNSKYTIETAHKAIVRLEQGESIKFVAESMGVSRGTFYNWALKYKKFGREFRKIQEMKARKRSLKKQNELIRLFVLHTRKLEK